MKKAISLVLSLCVIFSVFVFGNTIAHAERKYYHGKVHDYVNVSADSNVKSVLRRHWSLDSNDYGFAEISSGYSNCVVHIINYPSDGSITIRCEVEYLSDYGYFSSLVEYYNVDVERPDYTVYFNANHGRVSRKSAIVTHGRTLGSLLPTPKRKGYLFGGWYTQLQGGEKINSETVILSDMTVYARWNKIKKNKVTFDAKGGKPSQSIKKVKTGNQVGKLPTAKRKGYLFKGWYTKKKGGKLIKSTKKINSDITFYARWVKSVKITFAAKGGKASKNSKTFRKGAKIGKLPNAKRKNYSFDGWYTKAKNGKKVKPSTKFKSNKTIYAHWTKNIKVSYNPNGGTVKTKFKMIKKGSNIGNTPTPERKGYIFEGWFTKKSGGKYVAYTNKFSKNTTLYAQWSFSVKIKFNPTGGTVSQSEMIISKGGSVTDSFPTPEREGYTFKGWYTSDTAVNQVFASTDFKKPTEVYARWYRSTEEYSYILGNKTATIVQYNGSGENVTIPEIIDEKKITVIDDLAFFSNEKLKNIVIPDSVKKIGDSTFLSCKNLANVTLPKSLKSIGENAFLGCHNLEGVTVPSTVKAIGKYAFAKCEKLTVCVYKGSFAKKYAESNNLNFVVLD